ncbi:MAG TPA: HPF/RaiA family ribosome-associated protein [Acidimicrobiia bacterium]
METAHTDMTLVVSGDIVSEDVEYTRDRIHGVLDQIEEPVLFARLKLTMSTDPARTRPAIAEVTVDINGDLVRAQIAAETIQVAADLLKDRITSQLRRRRERYEARRRRTRGTGPGEWRHGNLPGVRPEHFDRPSGERELVRRKTHTAKDLTPEQAVAEMELLDYDFHLFRDLTTDQDALIERHGDDYRLTRLQLAESDLPAGITASGYPAPTLGIDEAIRHLESLGGRYLFFADKRGRGNVLYHRYDGHYGLITPE